MFCISANNLGKEFSYNWVFRELSFAFEAPVCIGLEGPNGSGKSTLLKIICGFQSPSEGTIQWRDASGETIKVDQIYQKFAIAAPYMELPEDLSLLELIRFHARFKDMILSPANILDASGLNRKGNAFVKDFSSGMKQRVRLSLALFSKAPMILLDEPRTNLDRDAIAWYEGLLEERLEDRMIWIASNEVEDFRFAGPRVSLHPH